MSISEFRGVLWVRHNEKGHRKVRELLTALGVIPVTKRVVKKAPVKTRSATPKKKTRRASR